MEVKGKIKLITETKTYGTNGFRKREVVIVTDEQYPQFLNIEFVQEKTELLDNFQPGDEVEISINLRGREWISPQGETKYFNSIQGWRITKLDANPPQEVPPPVNDGFEPADDNINDDDYEDDLPF
jgi:single-stranded DNA-binding protein